MHKIGIDSRQPEKNSSDKNKQKISEIQRMFTLSQILEKIAKDDPDYYRKILKNFRYQAVIDNDESNEMNHEKLAMQIFVSGRLFNNKKYIDYSEIQFANMFASILTPIPVESARKYYPYSSFSWIMNDFLDKNLIFKIIYDSTEYLVLPAEYRFMNNTHFRMSSEFLLENSIRKIGKTDLTKFFEIKGEQFPKSTSEIILKAKAYSQIICGFENILSKMPNEAKVLFDLIINSNGIVSIEEGIHMAKIADSENSRKNGDMNRNTKYDDSAASRLMDYLLFNFLVLTVKRNPSGAFVAYLIPEELIVIYANNKLSSVGKVKHVFIPDKITDQYSNMMKIRNFLFASYYLETHDQRRTTERLANMLSMDQENLALMDKFCRHLNYIYGSKSTYRITKSGMEGLENMEKISKDFINHLPTFLQSGNWNESVENSPISKTEIRVFDVLKSSKSAYSIQDICSLVKWNLKNIIGFRNDFLGEVSVRQYSKDRRKYIRETIFDPSNTGMVNTAIKHLIELGVVLTGHAKENGENIVMMPMGELKPHTENSNLEDIRKFVASKKTGMVVQSNYEVIVSPFEEFSILNDLMQGCELLTASTNIVLRITEKSLRFYSNNVGDLKIFLSTIGNASVHGVPETVTRTINDIAAHTGEITISKCVGILVFKDPVLMKRAETNRVISKLNTIRIADNVMGIVNSEDFEKIGKTLDNAGFLYSVHKEKKG